MKEFTKVFGLPRRSRAMSFTESLKSSWTRTLLTLICRLILIDQYKIISRKILTPAWLIGFLPVMEAKHDGEGAGGQQLLFVLLLVLVLVVIQAVGCRQGKSVANLRTEVKNLWNLKNLNPS